MSLALFTKEVIVVKKFLVLSISISLASCSTIQEKTGWDLPQPDVNPTQMGALNGSAIGGGLGLLVGASTGAIGGGLLIGALAGGTIGAGIAKKKNHDYQILNGEKQKVEQLQGEVDRRDQEIDQLKKQSTDTAKLKAIQTNDLALNSPIAAKTREASARASISNSNPGFLSKPSGKKPAEPFRTSKELISKKAKENNEVTKLALARNDKIEQKQAKIAEIKAPETTKVEKKELLTLATVEQQTSPKIENKASELPPAKTETEDSGTNTDDKAPQTTEAKEEKSSDTKSTDLGSLSSPIVNCKESIKEAEKGLSATSDADRLYYLKKAAKLCPSEPTYRVELGKVYSAAGKIEDAKSEFHRAIELDPNNQIARDELSMIENSGNN